MTYYDFSQHGIHTSPLTLDGLETPARVVSVYDGDTLTLVIPFKGDFYKFNCRMMGIDTCEIKSKILKNKETAIKARNRVLQLVGLPITDLTATLTKSKIQAMLDERVYVVWIRCYDFEKFGRVLTDVKVSQDAQTTIAKTLVSESLAYEYFGDTKLTEEQQSEL